MKLLELDLRAFGPFTDRQLDLSAGREGLHLVFGPNEAGKSSALRALRALLFGVPERTRDTFRHDNQALRLGGRIRNRQGEELAFVRRKGRKNTLLDLDDKSIGEDALAPFIGSVDERRFERLFGIDYETLVSGGQALLEERGREAEALFGTALGTVAIHRVLDRLDQEAKDLFSAARFQAEDQCPDRSADRGGAPAARGHPVGASLGAGQAAARSDDSGACRDGRDDRAGHRRAQSARAHPAHPPGAGAARSPERAVGADRDRARACR
jgi:hypothetical protein